MTSIGTLTNSNRAHMAVISPRVYFSNDRDDVQMWDGVRSSIVAAGITGPSGAIGSPSEAAGNVDIGVHLIRYRYRDSTSPQGRYRSNPSDALSHTVSTSAKELTFTITNSGGGGDIIRSDDAKVDTIIVEMTAVDGTVYYIATEVDNDATSAVVDISDANLILQDQSATFGGDFGHEPPPLCATLFTARDFTFACVFYPQALTASVTNISNIVTGTGFATGWAGRLFRVTGETRTYLIASVTNSTQLVLSENYSGTTDANASVMIFTSSPNRLYWSEQFYPESFRVAVRAINVMSDVDDTVVAGTEYLGDPWVFGKRTIQRLVFASDPSDGETVTVAGQSGVWNQRCLVKPDEDSMYGFGSNGVWVVIGGRPRWISRPADQAWRDLIDYDQIDDIHGGYDPETRTITWWFVATGDTEPKRGLTLDLTQQRWRIDQWRQGIRASTLISDSNGRVRSMVSDSTNAMTFYQFGDNDGLPSGTDGSYIAVGGGTTTSTQVQETLPTGAAGTGLDNLTLYRPATDETVVISDNTVDTFTHAAMATAVAANEKIYVGSIPVVIESSWFIGESQQLDKRPRYLHLHLDPSTTAATFDLYIYREFQTTAITWTSTNDVVPPDGVTWTHNDTKAVVDMDKADGFLSIPMPATWQKALKFKIVLDDPAGTFKLLDFRWSVNERADGGGE